MSSLNPPSRVSSPDPPISLSQPSPPLIVSLPFKPDKISLPFPPLIVSFEDVPLLVKPLKSEGFGVVDQPFAIISEALPNMAVRTSPELIFQKLKF